MNALRLAAAALALLAAPALVVLPIGCGDNIQYITQCGLPTVSEKAADGGPDPCHCDPPPSLGIMACACLSDPQDQDAIDEYGACQVLYRGQVDGGS